MPNKSFSVIVHILRREWVRVQYDVFRAKLIRNSRNRVSHRSDSASSHFGVGFNQDSEAVESPRQQRSRRLPETRGEDQDEDVQEWYYPLCPLCKAGFSAILYDIRSTSRFKERKVGLKVSDLAKNPLNHGKPLDNATPILIDPDVINLVDDPHPVSSRKRNRESSNDTTTLDLARSDSESEIDLTDGRHSLEEPGIQTLDRHRQSDEPEASAHGRSNHCS